MSIDRISSLQERLERLYFILEGLEAAKDKSSDDEKPRITLKIKDQWRDIRAVEQEYAQQLTQQVKRQNLPEAIAQTVVGELVDELEMMQPIAKTDEMRSMLKEILTELQKPGTPAAAKLKVAIPIIPNILTYEIEGDTESVVRRLFPTFVKVYEGIRAKKLFPPM